MRKSQGLRVCCLFRISSRRSLSGVLTSAGSGLYRFFVHFSASRPPKQIPLPRPNKLYVKQITDCIPQHKRPHVYPSFSANPPLVECSTPGRSRAQGNMSLRTMSYKYFRDLPPKRADNISTQCTSLAHTYRTMLVSTCIHGLVNVHARLSLSLRRTASLTQELTFASAHVSLVLLHGLGETDLQRSRVDSRAQMQGFFTPLQENFIQFAFVVASPSMLPAERRQHIYTTQTSEITGTVGSKNAYCDEYQDTKVSCTSKLGII